MSAAAYLTARGWRPHTFGAGWWQILVPSGRGYITPLTLPPGELERFARDLGWRG